MHTHCVYDKSIYDEDITRTTKTITKCFHNYHNSSEFILQLILLLVYIQSLCYRNEYPWMKFVRYLFQPMICSLSEFGYWCIAYNN